MIVGYTLTCKVMICYALPSSGEPDSALLSINGSGGGPSSGSSARGAGKVDDLLTLSSPSPRAELLGSSRGLSGLKSGITLGGPMLYGS